MSIELQTLPNAEGRQRNGGPLSVERQPTRRLAAFLSIAILVAVLALRYWPTLVAGVRYDVETYLAIFAAYERGESPYSVCCFLYSPVFAVLGGTALHWLGADAVRATLHAASLIATASLIWLSLSFLPWGAGARLAIGAAYLAFAPGVSLAMRTGNVSPVAGALVVAGLMAWPRATLLSGLALGGSLAWKPLGVLAIPMLALHRPVAPGRRHWIAAAVAAALALLWILLGATYLGDFLRMGASLDPRDIAVSRTVSLHRFLWSLGLPIDRLAVSIAVAVVALAAARRRRWSSTRTLCYAIAACCLTLPSLWPHTLLMTLPIQVLALRRAVERFTRRPRATGSDAGVVGALARERRGRTYELLLVMTGVAALQWSEGVGGVPTEPSLMLALAIAPPLFAPSLLALYALADEPRTDC